MRRSFARPAIALALMAMLFRGLLPAGWMPNPQGAAASLITICSMDGPKQMAMPGMPAAPHDDSGSGHDKSGPCVFAAAAPFAPIIQAVTLAPPSEAAPFASVSSLRSIHSAFRLSAHSPRAPPSLA